MDVPIFGMAPVMPQLFPGTCTAPTAAYRSDRPHLSDARASERRRPGAPAVAQARAQAAACAAREPCPARVSPKNPDCPNSVFPSYLIMPGVLLNRTLKQYKALKGLRPKSRVAGGCSADCVNRWFVPCDGLGNDQDCCGYQPSASAIEKFANNADGVLFSVRMWMKTDLQDPLVRERSAHHLLVREELLEKVRQERRDRGADADCCVALSCMKRHAEDLLAHALKAAVADDATLKAHRAFAAQERKDRVKGARAVGKAAAEAAAAWSHWAHREATAEHKSCQGAGQEEIPGRHDRRASFPQETLRRRGRCAAERGANPQAP